MHGNTFGRLFRLTTYGESHGPGLGGVVDGCPAGLVLREEDLQRALDKRKPGRLGAGRAGATARAEADKVAVVSGLFKGRTTGAPIAFYVANTDQRPDDYALMADVFRPGHADLGYECKYGFRDCRGGGRASGRETLCRVAGGAVAQAFIAASGVCVQACTLEIGGVRAALADPAGAEERPYFCPDGTTHKQWEVLLTERGQAGDSAGGLVHIRVDGMPPGLGEPVFDKLDARLAYALMGVGAVKGVEFGSGFTSARLAGSEHNDQLVPLNEETQSGPYAVGGALLQGAGFAFCSNNAGGVLGGISSGAPLEVTVAVKPIASIRQEQKSVTRDGKETVLSVQGRHDVCAIPRIVPVLKAMTALCLADFILLQRAARL